jgi:uncharacterized protein YkwD
VRRLALCLILGLTVIVAPGISGQPVAAATTASASPSTTEAEDLFVAKINELRLRAGLQPLRIHPELVALARRWAAKMAKDDRISHNPNLSTAVAADWQKLGENVGVGGTVNKLHDAFVASPGHFRNLVDEKFTYIGVGVVIGRDGSLFTAHEFMRLTDGAAAPSASAAPIASIAAPANHPKGYRLSLVLDGLHRFDAA